MPRMLEKFHVGSGSEANWKLLGSGSEKNQNRNILNPAKKLRKVGPFEKKIPFEWGEPLGFLSRMNSHVNLEIAWLRIRLGAFRTTVGLFPRVHPHVSLNIVYPAAGKITLGTAVGFFSCVCPEMIRQRARICKGLWTLRAFKRPFPGVDSNMFLQLTCLRKGLTALRTSVRLLSCMNPQVPLQCVQYGKRLGTKFTGEGLQSRNQRFLFAVNLEMRLQMRQNFKRLCTLITRKRPLHGVNA